MPLYWKNPPRAKGKAYRTQTCPISAVANTERRPKYTPTATATASSAKMNWRSDSPAPLIISDFFVDAYLDWISPPFPFLNFWQTRVAVSAGIC